MKGTIPTDNWLLTAYEKKEKSVSASSSDIETEPKGKRNGTATPQNGLTGSMHQTAASKPHGLASNGKDTESSRNISELGEKIAEEEEKVEQNPTDGQKEAGNYRKGHVKIDGFDVTIENPKGSERSGTDASGKQWSVTMNNTYGYIRRTEGVDGDHIDVFLSDHIDDWNGTVYVVDQMNTDGSFDEHKVMYGFNSEEEARAAYLSNYSEGWQGLGTITGVSKDEFKKWIDSSHRKTKAFAEYKNVKKDSNAISFAQSFRERLTLQAKENAKDKEFQEFDNPEQIAHELLEFADETDLYMEAERHLNELMGGNGSVSSEEFDAWCKEHTDVGEGVVPLSDILDEIEHREGEIAEDSGLRFRDSDNDVAAFAQEHNLNEKDVQDYADYMRRGNLNGASRAFHEIRRKIRLNNDGASFGEFVKLFSPVKKALYGRFGNIDELREQYVQAEMEERNVMEAARKRAEEAAEAERKRLQVFRDMSDEELDEEYLKAVEANDEGHMRDLVNEAAHRNGYGDVGSEYQGMGAWAAPSNPGYESDEERRAAVENDAPDVNVTDIAAGYSSQPADYFTNLRAYGTDTPHGRESAAAINKAIEEARNGKDPMVKVYRAVPKAVKEGSLRNGDWVTPSKKYAEMHGDNRLEGDYRIIEQEVPASQLWWDGNDINEWGFDDGKGYFYRNTRNNRKLNDLVTRDDQGRVIPLSQRFNVRKSDVRYRFIGEEGASRLDRAEEASRRMDDLAVARQMEAAFNERKERIEKLRKSEPVVVSFGNEYELNRESAKEWAKANLRGEYEIADTKENVQIGRKGINKTTSHSMGSAAHLKSIKSIPEMLRNAIFIAEETASKKTATYPLYRYYVVGLKIDGEDYTAKLTIGVDENGRKYYDHALTQIEKTQLLDVINNQAVGNGFISTGAEPNPSVAVGKDTKLFSLLQTNSQEKARRIKEATGWERGADGKWRHEEADGSRSRREREGQDEDARHEGRKLTVKERREREAHAQRQWHRAHDVAHDIVEKLNIADDVTVVDSIDELPGAENFSAEQRRAKGWYDTKTGKIVIVLGNHRSPQDVMQTILHEGVAHYGLRALFGRNFDQFLDNVFQYADTDVRRRIVDLAKKHGWNFRVATEEYLAGLAEDTDFERATRQGWWSKIKSFFLDMLHSIGLGNYGGAILTDNELRYILWRSYENLAEQGRYRNPFREAEDISKQHELKVGNYAVPASHVVDEASQVAESSVYSKAQSVNEHFNKQLSGLTEENADRVILSLGRPSAVLRAAGVEDMPMKLYGNKVVKKMKKHGFGLDELRDLPRAVANPIAVFDNIGREGNRSVLTELETEQGNFLVTIDLGKDADIDFNIVSSVFGKGYNNIVDWFNKGYATYINKEKALMFLFHQSAPIAATAANTELDSAANIVENFENPKVEEKEKAEEGLLFRESDETEDIWSDPRMSLQERITAAALRLAANHKSDKTLRNDAMKAIGSNLSDLRQAMSLQRTFDKSTARRVYDLARVLMNGGYLSDLSQQEVKRLLAAVKNSVGRKDIEGSVQKVMDIMVDNQLKNAEKALHDLELIKGSKVDARGVEVQGELDPTGQRIMQVFKKARGWEKKDIEEAIAEQLNRMGNNDVAMAEEAAHEYAGLQLALEYAENVKDSKMEERKLRDELKQAHEEASERDRATDGYRQYVASLEEAIRQNKIERAQSYFDLVGRLSNSLRESIANVKAFKEAEKQRIREIQHNANSDMEGRPSDEHYRPTFADKFVNNSLVQLLFAPLATFDQMLRMFGGKSANGEGYLYNRFMRGWVDARQKEIKGVREKYAKLDAKAAELFGGKVKTWGDLIRRVGKLPKGTVSFWNGGEMQERELTQGNLMYIYMVNKMLDGRMKLRKMGITESDVAKIEKVLNPKLIELADWLQEEFLVSTRNEYNETHKRMFGASMAAIENYFPLKILSNARADKPEDLDNPDRGDGISTATGSIIKRRRNALALDITGADALNVILDHVAQMEHWNAYAEFNRDLNTLRTYKRFRNQVQNMTTIYGSGKVLWKKFNDVCQMAAGTYRPPRAKLDEAATNFAKGVTAAKVSFRMFTALKQFLSMPAYLPEARAGYLFADIANPAKAWKWSMENLPIFNERWHSRMAGDPRLLKSDMDWKMWRTRIVQLASRAGMSPNAFVDALTVSIGSHSMYRTRFGQYLRDGYSQEDAERKARQDAEVLYNQTQQSSEGAFNSTMQVDRSWLSVLFTVFRNSSMSYQRQLHDALRNFKHNLTPGGRVRSIEFMKKQYVRDGIDETTAEQNAKRNFNRQLRKDTLRLATFGFLMQFAWNLGAYLPYLLFGGGGDDDDRIKDGFWDDVWAHTMFGWLEGLTGGDVMSQAGGMLLTGEGNPAYLSKDMPLTSDIMAALQKLGNGKQSEALSDIINLVVQSGIGVNPQSITDGVLAIMDACGDDPALAHEASICIMRILQVPQSQIDQMYFDEVCLSGDEVSKYTPAQLAERYARLKVKRGNFFAPWAWGDDERIGKFEEKAGGIIRERVEHMGDPAVNEAYERYEETYKGVDKQMKAAKKAAEKAIKTDYAEAARIMADVTSDKKRFAIYMAFKKLDSGLDKIAKLYISARSPEEASKYQQAMADYKSRMIEVLNAVVDNKADSEVMTETE